MQGEFRGDFTRDTSNRNKHFLRVLMQQGRVQVDADWNEQIDALIHYLQMLASNLIGPYGGPAGDRANFEVFVTVKVKDENNQDREITIIDNHNFVIGAGQYYVDGILCELEAIDIPIPKLDQRDKLSTILLPGWFREHSAFQANQYIEVMVKGVQNNKPFDSFLFAKIESRTITNQDKLELSLKFFPAEVDPPTAASITDIKIRQLITYQTQPHFLVQDEIGDGDYLVYLDVWERHVCHIEDRSDYMPGIREVALGGVDTATRSQIAWQVKLLPINDQVPENLLDGIKGMDEFREILNTIRGESSDDEKLYDVIRPGSGRLMARARRPNSSVDDPCTISSESQYRGAENQLYRVEIFSTDGNSPEFVWSRENSAVIFPIMKSLETKSTNEFSVSLEHLGRDSRFSILEGDLVEVVDSDPILTERKRIAFKVSKIVPEERQVTLASLSSQDDQGSFSLGRNYFLRRWDCLSVNKVDPTNDDWIVLENGIEIKFQFEDLKSYREGDYWLIPARTETGDVEWSGSSNNPLPLKPHGVLHHYAPLAIITSSNEGAFTKIEDCRRLLKRVFEVI